MTYFQSETNFEEVIFSSKMSPYQKPIIVALVASMIAGVSVTALWLPSYILTDKSYSSSTSEHHTTNLSGGRTNEKDQTVGGGSRGSMWGNIEKERVNNAEKKP